MTDTAITSATLDVSLLSPPEDGAFFLGRAPLQRFSGQGLPANVRPDAPPDISPDTPHNEHVPPYTRWRWDGDAWTQAEDHRGRVGYLSDGTERVITQWGPLPLGWSETRPEKPLAACQAEKRTEIQSSYATALAFLIMETPEATPLEAALAVDDMSNDDPEGLSYVRGLAEGRRDELLAQVAAAETPAAVRAIAVVYPV